MNTVRKWINAGPDEGALDALLGRVAERVPSARIDTLWIFPTRMAGGAESTVIVVAAFDEDPERRTVATAHFRVTRDKRGKASVALTMQEHGSAPVEATQRVVDGVMRRLGDEVGKDAPRRVEIGGGEDAWATLVAGEGEGADTDAGAGGSASDVSASDVSADADVSAPDVPQADETASETAAQDDGQDVAFMEDDETATPPHGDPLEEEAGDRIAQAE